MELAHSTPVILVCPCCSARLSVAAVEASTTASSHVAPPQSSSDNPRLAQLADREWLAEAYSTMSAQSIAVDLNCNPKTVLLWLGKHGIPKRPPGAAPPGARRQQIEARKAAAIAALQAWAQEHDGESPTQSGWTHERPVGAPSEGSIRDLFGSWNHGLVAAGLKPRRPGEYVSRYEAASKGARPGRNRQMVTGNGLSDCLPGTVKHFGHPGSQARS